MSPAPGWTHALTAPLERVLRKAADRAGRLGRPVLASASVRVCCPDPLSLFSASGEPIRAYWRGAGGGRAYVGLGAVDRLLGMGHERFKTVGSNWRQRFADAVIGAGAGELRIAPRSWAPAGDRATAAYRSSLRSSLRRLLEPGQLYAKPPREAAGICH